MWERIWHVTPDPPDANEVYGVVLTLEKPLDHFKRVGFCNEYFCSV